MKPLYIIGSGGFSKQVIEIIEELNVIQKEYELIGIIDDNPSLLGGNVLGYKIIGDIDYLKGISQKTDVNSVIAIGEGRTREKIYNTLPNVKWINLIHPKTTISRYFSIGEGNIICGGVFINPDCKIGNHSNINIGCTLGHDVVIKDFSTLMPGCNISGNVSIGNYCTIGTGSCIIQDKLVESNSIIGAGSVVIKKVKKDSVYVGVPAKKIKALG